MIDFHLHLTHRDRTPAETRAHLDQHGIQWAVLLPLEDEHDPGFPTEEAIAAAQEHPDRYIPFCGVDVRDDTLPERVRRYVELGCKGFGELKTEFPVDDPKMQRVYELCGELGVPVLIHFQRDRFGCNFPRLEDMLKSHPQTVFIGHAQNWWANISKEVPTDTHYPEGPVIAGGLTDRLLSEYENVYGDLSAGSGLNALTRDREFAHGFVQRHRKKLLWGTDCPCKDGKGTGLPKGCLAPRSLAVLRELCDEGTFNDITHNNAAKLLGVNSD